MYLRALASGLIDIALRPVGLKSVGARSRIYYPRILRGKRAISIGSGTRIHPHAWLEAIHAYGAQCFDPCIEIGDNVSIGQHVVITATSRVTIGDGCLFSQSVYISDTFHDVTLPSDAPLGELPLVMRGEVTIGRRCFIGIRACVLPGVTLGDGCVVGANSVVTQSFEAGSIIAGSPARRVSH